MFTRYKNLLSGSKTLCLLAVLFLGSFSRAFSGGVPPTVDIGLFPDANQSQSLEVRALPHLDFNGIVSNLVFTISWDTATGASLGSITQGFPEIAYVNISKSGGEHTSGSKKYQVFFASGTFAMSGVGAQWLNGQEVKLMTVEVVGGSGEFEIINDAFTGQISINGDYFISLGGVDHTGIIYAPAVDFCDAFSLSSIATDETSGSDGAIDVTPSGGQSPIAYLWSNGATTQDLSGLSAGIYMLTATDDLNCVAMLSDTVEAGADVVPPTITCSPDTTIANDSGLCAAAHVYADPVATDNNAGVTYTQTAGLASGSSFSVGTTTQTFLATDAVGNTAECSFNVTVLDTEAPSMDCPSPISAVNSPGVCGLVITELPLTWTDNCAVTGGASSHVVGDTLMIGVTTITAFVSDAASNADTCSFDVTVADTEAPMLTCPNNISVESDSGACTALVTFDMFSSDNCDSVAVLQTAGLSSGANFPVGVTAQEFLATDEAGSTTSCAFTVEVTTELVVSAIVVHETCDSLMQGAIDLSISGGDGIYSILWSNGATTEDISGLAAGIYSVDVSDGCGGVFSDSFEVKYQVVWKDLVGVIEQVPQNQLEKTNVTGWNSGAASENMLPGGEDGSISFTITNLSTDANRFYMIGLSNGNVDAHFNTIDYAWYYKNGLIRVYESGDSIGNLLPVSLGDELKISREGAFIRYYQNDVMLRQVSTDNSLNLIVDVSILIHGTVLENVCASFCVNSGLVECTAAITNTICGEDSGSIDLTVTGGVPPYTFNWSNGASTEDLMHVEGGTYMVTVSDFSGAMLHKSLNVLNEVNWTDMDGVTLDATSGRLTKSGPTAWDAGAASNVSLPPNEDGYMRFEITQTGTIYYMVGLSEVNPDAHFNTIDYAMYVRNGELRIMESGAYRGAYGPLNIGDQLMIVREGGMIKYKKNGVVVRAIQVNPNVSLLVDASILLQRSSMEKIVTSFCPKPDPFNISGTVDHSVCSNPQGAVTLSVNGAVAPTSFSWSDGSTVQDRTGLASGSYSVTATDNSGATVTEEFMVYNSVEWTDFVGMSLDTPTNTLVKNGATAWGTGGAASVNVLPGSTNGCMAHLIKHIDLKDFYHVGLSSVNADAHFNSIGYAFYYRGAELRIYESGDYQGSFGSVSLGDELRICRDGNRIKYYHNGNLVKSSGTIASLGLQVDVAALNTSDRIDEVLVSFCQPPTPPKDLNPISGYSWLKQISMYPNPAQTKVLFEGYSTEGGQLKLSISDIAGRVVMDLTEEVQSETNLKTQVDLHALQIGTYFVRLQLKKHSKTFKLVISR